jgi:hypothetical protein
MNNKTLTILFVILSCFKSLTTKAKNEIFFVQNVGQIHDQYGKPRKDIDFVLHATDGLNIFIGRNKINYQFIEGLQAQRIEAGLVGASNKAQATAAEQQGYYENHYHNSKLLGRAKSYKKITYKNIYPHIDWVLKINDNNTFEYEYAVGALGNAQDIQMEYRGAKKIQLQTNGDLVLHSPMGNITERAPQTYTQSGQYLASKYVLKGNKLSYQTDPYAGALVIDPKVAWATYYGDTTMFVTTNTSAGKIKYNNNGQLYFCGITNDIKNIATLDAFQATLSATTGSKIQIYYVKLDTNCKRLYATYFGSSKHNGYGSLSVNNDTVYLVGNDESNTLATVGAEQTSFAPYNNAPFIAKFEPSGNLLWCTYVGGNNKYLTGGECFLDGSNNVYFFSAADTMNPYIATPGAYKTVKSDSFDAVIVKYNSAGKKIWGTFYGGKGNETVFDAVYVPTDGSGALYIIGNTTSDTGIATPGAYQTIKKGTNDAMLIKFDTSGRRIWGTYLGGELVESARGITSDKSNNVYVAGQTNSLTGIATAGAYQTSYGGGLIDMFLMKFDKNGFRQWGTYFGGSNNDGGNGLCSDQLGNVFICGTTRSLTNIADTAAFQKSYGGGTDDGFIAAFKPNGKKFWSSYYGGEGIDRLFFAASDGRNIYLTGISNSKITNIATKGSLVDTNANGNQKGLILKISEAQIGYTSDTLDPVSISDIIISNKEFSLYPNPNKGLFIVEGFGIKAKMVELTVVNILGKPVWNAKSKIDNNGSLKQEIELESLNAGVYFLHCKGDEGNQVIEFVKN